MSEKEEWVDIKGYEGFYQVSQFGNVRSVDRRIWVESMEKKPHYRELRGVTLTPIDHHAGIAFTLGTCGSDQHDENHWISASRLVYAAFIGDIPAGYNVAHLDGDYRNCVWDNLFLKPMAVQSFEARQAKEPSHAAD